MTIEHGTSDTQDMGGSDTSLLSFEESVEAIVPLLGTVIRPTIYRLHDGEFMACLAVDPDVAFAALQTKGP